LLGGLPEPKSPAQPRVERAPVAPPDVRSPVRGARDSGRPRYLIVDDDGVCRELLKDILSRYGQCDFAYDGGEAIDAVRLALEDGDYYDLICLDIMMPGSSGHEALESIRELEEEHGARGSDQVRVIMTTALRDSKHCIRAFREGCEAYVTKPIDQRQLLAKMRELGLLGVAEGSAK
jgi:two-component system, chemotaxis family, chemotaxis protein CheY